MVFFYFRSNKSVFTAVVSLGLTAGMMRWYAVEDDEQKRKIIVFTTWVTTFILALFVNVAFYPANKWFSSIFFLVMIITPIIFLSFGYGWGGLR